MQIDIAKQLGLVSRGVVSHEHDGRPAHAVVLAQTYATDATDLWDAVTNAERLPRWFAPVSGDLRPGGRYQVEGNAGGTILVCQPPKHLKLTWEFAGQTSWVDVTIESVARGSSRLTLEHLAHVDDHWNKFGPGATGVGWDLALVGLDRHVAGSLQSAKDGMAWMMSDEGKSFMRRSSEGWCRAAIAAGTDPAIAKQMADQTTAAFAGA